jgi:acyl carrier protein
MFDRDDIIEIIQQAFADVLGVYESDVTLDALLQAGLGLDPDDLEDVVAHLQSVLEIHIAPDDLFPDDSYDRLTVQSIVNALERRIGNA